MLDDVYRLRLSTGDRDALDRLAQVWDRKRADVLRQLIRREVRQLDAHEQQATPRRSRRAAAAGSEQN